MNKTDSRNTDCTNLEGVNHELFVDLDSLPGEVLKRLIEEVRFEAQNNITAYNRTHNRHNRGR